MEHRSSPIGHSLDQNALDSLQFNEHIQHLMTAPPENANSFTALLDLLAPQAVQLLHHHHSPEPNDYSAAKPNVKADGRHHHYTRYHFNPGANLIERATKFSAYATDRNNNYSPDTMGLVPSSGNLARVKNEPAESDPNLSQPLDRKDQNQNKRSAKRKEREKKGKAATKKSKSGDNDGSEDAEKLPYVHVRASRGQATDSHSLAERARREKINARMKLLQELVPGCDKISGTALVLDEIINHVQSLQSQVEFLSMRLAAVNPRIDFNLNSILAAEGGSLMDSNFTGMIMPVMWPEVQANGNRQQYQKQWGHFDGHHQLPIWRSEEESNNFVISENSLSSSGSAISATLHSNQLKMEQ